MPVPGCEFFTKSKGLQKTVNNIVMKEVFSATDCRHISDLCIDRWSILFHPFDIQFDGALDIDAIFDTLKAVRGSTAIKVPKTWLNGWATSAQMHED